MHCVAGISRSVTIVIGYLMRKHGRCFDDVLGDVRKRRPVVIFIKLCVEQSKCWFCKATERNGEEG